MTNTPGAKRIWPAAGRLACALTLLLMLLAGAMPGRAEQQQPMVFRNITVMDGLSQNTVMDVHQDSEGFLWLATENGLDRYDGRKFVSYERGATSRGELASDYIWDISEDADGNLWLATEDGGVAIWNRATDRFSHLQHNAADSETITSNRTRAVLHTSEGTWIATQDAGLNFLQGSTGRILRYRHDPANPSSLPSDAVYALIEDSHGGIWVATDAGLAWITDLRGGFVNFQHEQDNDHSLSGNQIRALMQDRHGAIWIGTFETGLNVLDRRSGRFKRFSKDAGDPTGRISSNHIRSILEDDQGRIWVGTESGLNLLLPYSEQFHSYQSSDEHGALRDDYIMSLHQDRSGVLWIGTRVAGVHGWNPMSWSFGHQQPAWLERQSVTSFATDPNTLWVGTFGAGLWQRNLTSGASSPVVLPADDFDGSKVMSLLKDRRGGLWIGSMTSGVAWRGAGKERFAVLRHDPDDANSLAHDGTMSLFEDSSGRIWIGSFRAGATRYDRNSGRFRRFGSAGAEAGCGAQIRDFAEDAQGNIWFATERGICRLDAGDETIASWQHDQENPSSIGANSVYALHRDPQGDLWAGTHGGGLTKVLIGNYGDVDFRNITRRDGLANNVVYGIESDGNGALWLSTNNGLSRVNPATGVVRNYNRTHGLQGEEFHFGASHQGTDGQLYFGGSNGYNGFDPLNLQTIRAIPPVLLTQVLKMNVPLATTGLVDGIENLSLAHREASVTFEFAALDYTAPQNNHYRYRLEGFDKSWVDAGTSNTATYTNLPGGSYTFRVAAASSDGIWNEDGLALPLEVAPPPWAHPAAYVAYVLALLLALWGVYQYQARRLREAAAYQAHLEHDVAERTRELEHSNEALERASNAKSDFLARMSHEIRSPIHGVLGTTELLARTQLSAPQRRFAETIAASTKSLLEVINDVLDFSKLDSSKMTLDAEDVDLEGLLDEVVDGFAGSAVKKGLTLSSQLPAAGFPTLRLDPMRLRQVLVNLLSNALKFTSSGGVELSAAIVEEDNKGLSIRFAVRDSGIGIAPENQSHIFEAFSQETTTTARRFGGTGLGLSICRELISLMGGSLALESEPGVGSTFAFEISLPRVGGAAEAPPTLAASVLIVTDDETLRQQLQRYLQAWGARCRRLPEVPDDLTGVDLLLIDGSRPTLLAQQPRLPAGARAVLVSPYQADLAAPWSSATMTLPLRRRSLLEIVSQQPAASARAPEAEPKLCGRVLVVEDSATNRELLEGMLFEIGCKAAFAEDGATAVTMATADDYDAIVMDYLLPDFNGIDATRLIRASDSPRAKVPIIALTANVSPQDRASCLAAGMNDFLGKPCTIDELAQALARWVPVQQRAPELAEQEGIGAPDATTDVSGEFDVQVLERVRRLKRPDGSDMLSHAVRIFQSTCEETLASMQDACRQRAPDGLRFAAHKLKSSAANLGAVSMANLCREVEQLAGEARVAEAEPLLDEIKAYGERALAWLKEHSNAVA